MLGWGACGYVNLYVIGWINLFWIARYDMQNKKNTKKKHSQFNLKTTMKKTIS